MKEPAYEWRTKRIRNRLAEALEMSAAIIALQHDNWNGALCRLYLAAARELIDGVLAELDAHRPTNAMRLARHLWEYEQELAYVLGAAYRVEQLFAEDAHQALEINRLHLQQLPLSQATIAIYTARVDQAKASAVLRGATGSGRSTPRGWRMPRREVMADALEDHEAGRRDSYDTYYRLASQFSHPGPFSASTYVVETKGRLEIRTDARDDVRAYQAVVVAAIAFVNLLDTANWVLDAKRGAEIRDLARRVVGRRKAR